jgi:hypothetical protein
VTTNNGRIYKRNVNQVPRPLYLEIQPDQANTSKEYIGDNQPHPFRELITFGTAWHLAHVELGFTSTPGLFTFLRCLQVNIIFTLLKLLVAGKCERKTLSNSGTPILILVPTDQ